MIRAPRVLVVGVLALTLAGCTAAPAVTPSPTASFDPQVRAAECSTLITALNGSIQAMAGITPEAIAADPAGALRLFENSVDTIDGTVTGLTDVELKTAASNAASVMRDYLDTARDALADPKNVDKTLITAQTALVQDSLQKVAALCS